jgi:hypothetical protein
MRGLRGCATRPRKVKGRALINEAITRCQRYLSTLRNQFRIFPRARTRAHTHTCDGVAETLFMPLHVEGIDTSPVPVAFHVDKPTKITSLLFAEIFPYPLD